MEATKNRVWALTEVGKYVGKDEMLAQIKEDEAEELWYYTRVFFANVHGLSQAQEMRINALQSEGKVLGFEYLKAIRDYCLDIINRR